MFSFQSSLIWPAISTAYITLVRDWLVRCLCSWFQRNAGFHINPTVECQRWHWSVWIPTLELTYCERHRFACDSISTCGLSFFCFVAFVRKWLLSAWYSWETDIVYNPISRSSKCDNLIYDRYFHSIFDFIISSYPITPLLISDTLYFILFIWQYIRSRPWDPPTTCPPKCPQY